MAKYLLFLLLLFLGTAGQILLKMEANQLMPLAPKINSFGSFMSVIFLFLRSYKILMVLFLYGIGFFTWIFILSKFELSYAFPIMAIMYIVILFSSWIFLGEHINVLRIIGTLVISIGIALSLKS